MITKLKNNALRPVATQDGQIIAGPLISGLSEIIRKPVKPQTGLKIRRIQRAISQQNEDVEAERMRLLEKYARKDKDGQMLYRDEAKLAIDLEDEAGFTQEFNELLDLEFEVEALTGSELEQIGDVTTLLLINLGDLIVDEGIHTNGNTAKAEAAQKRAAKRKA